MCRVVWLVLLTIALAVGGDASGGPQTTSADSIKGRKAVGVGVTYTTQQINEFDNTVVIPMRYCDGAVIDSQVAMGVAGATFSDLTHHYTRVVRPKYREFVDRLSAANTLPKSLQSLRSALSDAYSSALHEVDGCIKACTVQDAVGLRARQEALANEPSMKTVRTETARLFPGRAVLADAPTWIVPVVSGRRPTPVPLVPTASGKSDAFLTNIGLVALCSLVLSAFAAYFAPLLIATHRGHPNVVSIGIINLFLGWTLLGWVVSLAWACTAISER